MSDMQTELGRAMARRRVLTNEERRELAVAAFGEPVTARDIEYVNKMAFVIQRWLEEASSDE